MQSIFASYSKTPLRRFLVCILLCAICGAVASAKNDPLSEKERMEFANVARQHYAMTMMDGASVYRFKGRELLLVIVQVKSSPNVQRVGQVKATRAAGEFLQSATNKSVTIYETGESNTYSLKDKSEEKGTSAGATVSDIISQGTSDITTTETTETFSDQIVQSSLTRVSHIEPLCRLGAENGYQTFAYFMILEK
jgi:hypothetical protein